MVKPAAWRYATAALAALLLAALDGAQAAPIETNAVTPVGPVTTLNKDGPMRGNRGSPQMVKPVVLKEDPKLSRDDINKGLASDKAANTEAPKDNLNGQASTTTRRERHLEVTSTDLERLELYFGQKFDTNLNTLFSKYPRQYDISPVPWPSSYWPTYQDSINSRWDGYSPSPAEKYATAFGLDVKQFMDKVSSTLGIDTMAGSPPCRNDNECSEGSCAMREGQSSGYCIPHWWGICHAWTPASILEVEPQCSVTKNGVKFNVFDIKALATAVYDDAAVPVVFTGARYDGLNSTVDEYGRYTDPAERDLGAGFFHIAVVNMLGRFQHTFIIDADAEYPVWNQPVRGYNIVDVQMMGPGHAASQFFNIWAYPFNNDAVKIAYVHMVFRYINEMFEDGPLVSTGRVDVATKDVDYYYVLELDADDNILGGEWVGDSRKWHPDFLWFVTDKPSMDTVTNIGLKYKDVVELLKASQSCSGGNVDPGNNGNNGNNNNGGSTNDQCAAPEDGIDYYGDDLRSDYGITQSECCTRCSSTPGCKAYSYVASSTGCYLKKGTSGRVSTAGVSSALVKNPINGGGSGGGGSTNDQCAAPEDGIDYYGDDLRSDYGITQSECCTRCSVMPGCKAYSYVASSTACYLKKGTGERFLKAGVSSALVKNPINGGGGGGGGGACGTPAWALCGNPSSGASCCPSGQYCQPWDHNYFQCIDTPAQCQDQRPNVDFFGDDLMEQYNLGPGECCAACAATPGCKAYTFINEGTPTCYLKKGTGNPQYHAVAVSGVVN